MLSYKGCVMLCTRCCLAVGELELSEKTKVGKWKEAVTVSAVERLWWGAYLTMRCGDGFATERLTISMQ